MDGNRRRQLIAEALGAVPVPLRVDRGCQAYASFVPVRTELLKDRRGASLFPPPYPEDPVLVIFTPRPGALSSLKCAYVFMREDGRREDRRGPFPERLSDFEEIRSVAEFLGERQPDPTTYRPIEKRVRQRLLEHFKVQHAPFMGRGVLLSASTRLVPADHVRNAIGEPVPQIGHVSGDVMLFVVDQCPNANLAHAHFYVFMREDGTSVSINEGWPLHERFGPIMKQEK